MLRAIFGVTLATTMVALIAAVSVIGMILLIDATDVLTQNLTRSDTTYLADLSDGCDAFPVATCDYGLN